MMRDVPLHCKKSSKSFRQPGMSSGVGYSFRRRSSSCLTAASKVTEDMTERRRGRLAALNGISWGLTVSVQTTPINSTLGEYPLEQYF